MPFDPHNVYKTNSTLNFLARYVTDSSRWELIQKSLWREHSSSKNLEHAILTYNQDIKHQRFKSLHAFFEKLDENESKSFFNQTLPAMIELALQLPEIIKSTIPLLKQGQNQSISLSQKQIACLLANAFLCTFPHRNEYRRGEYRSYPSINFGELYAADGDQTIEKIRCIYNYFRRVCSQMPTGVVTFTRRSIPDEELPQWDQIEKTFSGTQLHVTNDGKIENDGKGLLQVDFVNKFVGGGTLGRGCVQEEILFVIYPELICSRLFTERFGNNECMIIVGCERFNNYEGYASTFKWTGDCNDETPLDLCRRRKSAIVAIDAENFSNKAQQYQKDMLKCELNKAFIGFKYDMSGRAPGVTTGKWGCDIFGGDKHLKSLLQLMACCITDRPLVYYTFGDDQLRSDLLRIHEFLVMQGVQIGELFTCLCHYNENGGEADLYQFIIEYFTTRSESGINDQSFIPPSEDCDDFGE
ncbi:poly(ADP-ribose) glycohydrolase-like [Sitodiplosis mosellana]|uniref:poly(ADP-ribose) glycohydrolase-like n=1 Tax=Sitodiplosis mosellana TaxID=263140 RepID=UPI002444D672|nr:poly(ADP-ribose) glycohydrolase-like [Sitodiplosis mosellana]